MAWVGQGACFGIPLQFISMRRLFPCLAVVRYTKQGICSTAALRITGMPTRPVIVLHSGA